MATVHKLDYSDRNGYTMGRNRADAYITNGPSCNAQCTNELRLMDVSDHWGLDIRITSQMKCNETIKCVMTMTKESFSFILNESDSDIAAINESLRYYHIAEELNHVFYSNLNVIPTDDLIDITFNTRKWALRDIMLKNGVINVRRNKSQSIDTQIIRLNKEMQSGIEKGEDITQLQIEIDAHLDSKRENEALRKKKYYTKQCRKEHRWWKLIKNTSSTKTALKHENRCIYNDAIKDKLTISNVAELYDQHPFMKNDTIEQYNKKFEDIIKENAEAVNGFYDERIIKKIINDTLDKKSRSKGTGIDPLSWNIVKNLHRPFIVDPLVIALQYNSFKDIGKLVGIPKKSGGIRFIRSNTTDASLIESTTTMMIKDEIKLELIQNGGITTTMRQIVSLRIISEIRFILDLPFVALIADFDKAFDRAINSLNLLQYHEEQENISLKALNMKYTLSKNNTNLVFNGNRAICLHTNAIGLPQGSTSSTLDYSITTNKIFEDIKELNGIEIPIVDNGNNIDDAIAYNHKDIRTKLQPNFIKEALNTQMIMDIPGLLFVDDTNMVANDMSNLKKNANIVQSRLRDVGAKIKASKTGYVRWNDADTTAIEFEEIGDIKNLGDQFEYLGVWFVYNASKKILDWNKHFQRNNNRMMSSFASGNDEVFWLITMNDRRSNILANINTYGMEAANIIESSNNTNTDVQSKYNRVIRFAARKAFGQYMTTSDSITRVMWGIPHYNVLQNTLLIKFYRSALHEPLLMPLIETERKLLDAYKELIKNEEYVWRDGYYKQLLNNSYYTQTIDNVMHSYGVDLNMESNDLFNKISTHHMQYDLMKIRNMYPNCLLNWIFDFNKKSGYSNRCAVILDNFIDEYELKKDVCVTMIQIITGNNPYVWNYEEKGCQLCNMTFDNINGSLSEHWINQCIIIEREKKHDINARLRTILQIVIALDSMNKEDKEE
eukprot:123332_1